MNCSGSNVILKALDLPPTDEADYAAEGTAAHEGAASCVVQRKEAWEIVGEKLYKDHEVTVEMADAIQVYLDHVNPLKVGSWWCEFHISDNLHPLFYGTVDFAAIDNEQCLHIVDFKYGAGIVVEATENPQLKYYAYGLLQNVASAGVRRVRLTIVQPRAWHPDSRVRSWDTTAEEINEWGEKTLLPAMQAAEIDETLNAGSWCRFCPAKLACPLLYGLFKAAVNANPKDIPNLSDEALGRDYALREVVKFYLKAQEDDMYRRLSAGRKFAETKLVYKKADRVFKDGAKEALQAALGAEVYTQPSLKTPAQIEALGSKAKTLVKEWAYTPQTGYTVALADDKRIGVTMQTTQQAFGNAIEKMEKSDV